MIWFWKRPDITFSVIIPARNAEETLPKTFESLAAQTFSKWEAILIDDGSTDSTLKIAKAAAARDRRIRVIRKRSSVGVSKARNISLKRARTPWVLFLDADDWIAPEYFSKMAEAIQTDPHLDVVHCEWAYVAMNGLTMPEPRHDWTKNLFYELARTCPLAIHACVVRRSLLRALGGFDVSLVTCEDWDLWQRLARRGARFGHIPILLAFYLMRPRSASKDVRQFLLDSFGVIRRGHSSDRRVSHRASRYPAGAPKHGETLALYYNMIYAAALALGTGQDPFPVLETLKDVPEPGLDQAVVIGTLYTTTLFALGAIPVSWPRHYNRIQPALTRFLEALERQSQAAGLARRTQIVLERMIVRETRELPLTLSLTHVMALEVTQPIQDLHLPPQIEQLHARIVCQGELVGWVQLPVIAGCVPASVLADAIAADWAWPILGRFFSRHLYQTLAREAAPGGMRIRRGAVALGNVPAPSADPADPRLHDGVGWIVFLQELWGHPEWEQERFYAYGPEEAGSSTITLESDELSVEISEPLPNVWAKNPVRIEWLVGGSPVLFELVEPPDGFIASARLRAHLMQYAGFELVRIVVREALLGTSLDEPLSLRERLRRAALRRAEATPEDTTSHLAASQTVRLMPSWRRVAGRALADSPGPILGRHGVGMPGTSASRRARLPGAAEAELLDAAAAAGEPVVRDGGSPTTAALTYAPEMLWLDAGRAAAPQVPAPATPDASSDVRDDRHQTHKLPILMYHEIAPRGTGALSRYRIEPKAFEEQIRYLHEAGFKSATLEEWQDAMRRYTPLPGRRVLLTFDDGYRDFAKAAWPVLKRYGFGAMVFLVSDRIGERSDWNAPYGETSPLMTWDEIRRLQAEGVQFGSHAATHRRLEALSPADVVREAAHSRAVLSRGLGAPVTAFAYPYGSESASVQHLIGACGYTYGLSCRSGRSDFIEPLLSLPRLEVEGDKTITDFIRMLGT